MNRILFKAYPFLDNSYRSALLKVLMVATFAVFFLYFFNNENDKEELPIFVKFGIIIATCQFTFLFFLPKLFLKSHDLNLVPVWQYGLWLFIFIGVCYVAIFSFQQYAYFHDPITLSGFKCFLRQELPTGLIICFVLISLDYAFMLRKQLRTVHTVNEQIDLKKINTPESVATRADEQAMQPAVEEKKEALPFTICDEQQKSALSIQRSSILFIKGADNYIEVFFLNDNGSLTKELIRNTLSAVESYPDNDFLFRVHRSYLCHLNNVVKISGNSKGYNLHFSGIKEIVPVSRTKSEEVVEKLNKLFTG